MSAAAFAVANAAATSTFYQDLNREQAEEAVRQRPHQPILRPCSYTPSHPHIYAVTYRGASAVQHSLVELHSTGRVYELEVREGRIVRTYEYPSVEALETTIRQLSRRMWLHAQSIVEETPDVFPISATGAHEDIPDTIELAGRGVQEAGLPEMTG